MHRAHFTPCLHGVYIVHTLPVRVLREVVKMSSAFPRPTISAANGCAIIAAFPLNRLHNRMRPIDAGRVYTSTGQVALTILLQNGDPMLIVELTRLLLQWLWADGLNLYHTINCMYVSMYTLYTLLKRTLSPYFRNSPLLHITIRLHLTSRLLKFMQWLARKQYVLCSW